MQTLPLHHNIWETNHSMRKYIFATLSCSVQGKNEMFNKFLIKTLPA